MHFDPGDAPPGAELTQLQRVARATARTVPRIMGTLSAGFRESGDGIHPSQLRTLMMLHGGAVSPSDLAEQMEVSLPRSPSRFRASNGAAGSSAPLTSTTGAASSSA